MLSNVVAFDWFYAAHGQCRAKHGLAFLDDPYSELSAQESWQTFSQLPPEKKANSGALSRGFTHATSWLMLPIPPAEDIHYLHIKPGYLNDLQVFAVHTDGLEQIFSSYSSPGESPYFAIPIVDTASRPTALLLRLNTTSSHVLVADWVTASELDELQQQSATYIGAYTAVLGVLALVYLLFGLRLGLWLHAVYACYLSAVIVITLCQHGYVAWLPWQDWRFSSHIVGAAVGLSFALMALFLKLFLMFVERNIESRHCYKIL